jgi:hypothetical protein
MKSEEKNQQNQETEKTAILANGPAQSTPSLCGAPDSTRYERGIGFSRQNRVRLIKKVG